MLTIKACIIRPQISRFKAIFVQNKAVYRKNSKKAEIRHKPEQIGHIGQKGKIKVPEHKEPTPSTQATNIKHYSEKG